MYKAVLFFLLIAMISCTAPTRFISYTVSAKPVYAPDPAPQKILLLNNFDIAAKKFRDSKEELFISLVNDLMDWAGKKITEKANIPAEVIHGYTNTAGNSDSTINALLTRYNATHAIVINHFDIFFNKTNVEVTKEYGGSKTRTAYYDIESDVGYTFYSATSLVKDMHVHRNRFHSSRNVASGLLAVGPSIVAQKDDGLEMTIDNIKYYLNYFFPGEAQRSRQLFTGKDFPAVSTALIKEDYEAAMIESLRFIDDPNKQKAAKALYNCAVLYERKNQQGEAKKYLERSLATFVLDLARIMMTDYE